MGGTLACAISVTSNFRDKLIELYTDLDVSELDLASSNTLTKCFQTARLTHTIYYGAVILVVLHELLLYPMFHRCCRQLESLQKVIIGIIGHMFLILTLMAYEVVSRHSFISSHGHNTTIQCTFFVNPGTLSTSFGCMDSVDWNGGMEWWNGLEWNGQMQVHRPWPCQLATMHQCNVTLCV